MAYRESHPGVTQVVLFIVLISIFILVHFIIISVTVSVFSATMDSSGVEEIGFMAAFCSLYYLAPLTFIYMIICLGVAMYRRDVYGKAHENATLAALLVPLVGPALPMGLSVVALMFHDGYYIVPFMVATAMVTPFVSLFLFIKDIGGKVQAATGLTIYCVGAFFLACIVTVGLVIGDDLSDGTAQLLSAMAIPWAIVLMVGVLFFLFAYIKGLAWVKAHKPALDEQQVQQISMQKEQITMQIRSLEMQKQQLEMQEKALSMLSDIRSDQLIDSGRELIPEKRAGAGEATPQPGEPRPGDGH
jgi:hypothetical protein